MLSEASRSIRSGLPPAQNEARISTVKSAYLRRSRSNPWRTVSKDRPNSPQAGQKSGFGKLLGGDGADESKMDEAARPGTARLLTASNEPGPLGGIPFRSACRVTRWTRRRTGYATPAARLRYTESLSEGGLSCSHGVKPFAAWPA